MITRVTERWSDGQAGESAVDEKRSEVNHTRAWTVQTDRPSDDEMVAMRAREIPRWHTPHPTQRDLWVLRLSCRRSEGPQTFVVTAEYGPISSEKDSDNPFNRPAEVSWGSEASEEPIDMDVNGRPIVNTAGEGFDPPITKVHHDPVCTVTRNERGGRDHVSRRQREYIDRLNADRFWGWAIKTVRMDEIAGEFVVEGKWRYWRLSYHLKFRDDGWRKRALNTGTREVIWNADGQGYSYRTIKDATDTPLNTCRILKPNGQAVDPREPYGPVTGSASTGKTPEGIDYEARGGAVWLLFEVYKTARFGRLRLPGS